MSFNAESGYHETKESDIIIINGSTAHRKRNGIVYKILNSFRKPEKEMLISTPTNVSRRGTSSRLPLVYVLSADDKGLDNGWDEKGDEKRIHGTERKFQSLISGFSYCVCSCSMILLNKVVLSSYGFNAGISLMLYQDFLHLFKVTYASYLPLIVLIWHLVVEKISLLGKKWLSQALNAFLFITMNLVAVITILILRAFGVVTTEKLTWRLVRVWIPVNMIFIGMLITGMYSLKYINVAMVTVLKNVTNILTAIGDTYIFRRHQNAKVWAALFLMIISAVCGGITDLSFNARGYNWQALNCILTASYSLTLRRVMDVAKQATRSGSLNEVSMVLLNNLLSLPFAIILIILFNEWEYVYSLLVESLNKIPISIAGILVFNVPINLPNFSSILFGLFAGVFFAKAKMS